MASEHQEHQLLDVDHVFLHEFTKIINSMQDTLNALAPESLEALKLYDSIVTMLEFREFIKVRVDNNVTFLTKGGTGGYYG